MTLVCVNQETGTEYPPYDLTRLADNNWTVTESSFATTVPTVTNLAGQGVNLDGGGAGVFFINYTVTAVDTVTGEESLPCAEMIIGNQPLGSGTPPSNNVLTWNQVVVAGRSFYYNIYAETAIADSSESAITIAPPTSILGRIGQTFSTSFTDTGISPDFSYGPPQHSNPFARGQIISGQITSGGNGYNFGAGSAGRTYQSQINATINTSTGSGGVVIPQVNALSQTLGSLSVQNAGANYATADTVTIGGDGSGATATLTIGPQTGTYPGAVSYFQERRVYAASLNNPDTYWMSKPGMYLNFDTSFPSVASDAITGSPWATQVNGIQWMINMPGGLVVLTGLGAWQLTGAGGSSLNPQPVTPADEQVQPQAYNGVSAVVPPIKIDSSILYVQAKGSIYREFTYQYFQNIYTGVDLTELASHLFTGFTMLEHAYCEEPYKIIWAVRDDGILLSLTYLKDEQVTGWARHDTNGLYVSCCTVTEPPVDALYLVTQRTINGETSYMVERMNNRIWFTVEDAWCVDAALEMPQPTPNAILACNTPNGSGTITTATVTAGGSGYSSGAYAVIVDDNGEGIGVGAVIALSISGGVITGATVSNGGQYYAFPQVTIIDPANSGSAAAVTCTLSNSATFTAIAAVFSEGSIGSIIRMGGGMAEITGYTSATSVTANILVPITEVYPNSGSPTSFPVAIPQAAGSWTLTAPTTTVGGLYHLIGNYVTGLADGNVIAPQIVSADGTITLSTPASAVVVGLGFTAQLQSPYFDAGEKMLSQGRRKRIVAATARIELSRGLQMGANQPDGASLSPIQVAPPWSNLDTVPDRRIATYNGLAAPLYTGDVRIPVKGENDTRGQLAMQQSNPLPMTVLAFVPEIFEADIEAGKNGSAPAGGGGSGSLGTGFYVGEPPLTIAFTDPPTTGTLGVPLTFTGTVYLPDEAVQIAFSESGTVIPETGWVEAYGQQWHLDRDFDTIMSETLYCWAQQIDNQEVFAVTPVTFGAASPVTLLSVSGGFETGVSTLFNAETSGTVALQGGFSSSPTELPSEWYPEFGVFDFLYFQYHGICPPAIELSGTIYAWASEIGDVSTAVQYPENPIIIQNNPSAMNVSTISSQTGHYTFSAYETFPTESPAGTSQLEFVVIQPALSETATVTGYLTTDLPSSQPTSGSILLNSVESYTNGIDFSYENLTVAEPLEFITRRFG